jgi:glycosyltransferase involved in cell wall biosynthesis
MTIQVCYVTNSVSATSVPATIATALVDHTDITVDILAWFDAEPFEGDDRVGVTCLDAPRSTVGIDRATYRRAKKHLQQYDLIQANTNHSGVFAKLIGYELGIPLVSREGNTRNGFTRKGRIANGLTNTLVGQIVPNSRSVYESFTRWERLLIDDKKVRIIHNGVDLDRIDQASESEYDIRELFSIPADGVIVGTASVITEQKALDVLVEGVDIANNNTSQRIDLLIAGDGPRRSEIKRLSKTMDMEDRVYFAGMLDRQTVYRVLKQIDIYAMPSRWEGFANAAVEALGARNPCVFSEIDPFLLPYRNVALFHRVDDSEELAAQLVELAQNPDLREHYAQKGRELVEKKYTLEQIAQEYADLYAEIL